jgi:hypothetical protein
VIFFLGRIQTMRPPLRPLRYMFVRTKTTLDRSYKNKKSAGRRRSHATDPLKDNPRALVVPLLEDNVTFIHRPPPTAPSPHSLTTAPSSPLLRPSPPSPPTDSDTQSTVVQQLPPVLRPSALKEPPPRLSDEAIEEMRRLRLSDPQKYTRGMLARMFGCTTNFVGYVAALKRSQRRPIVAAREEAHERMRERWGTKKSLAKDIKQKRREFW